MLRRIWTIKELLNPSPVSKFNKMIGMESLSHKTLLDPGDNLLYFNPYFSELSPDGYYHYQTPTALSDNNFVYLRRLWVQGSMEFVKPLQFDSWVTCIESIKFIKKIKDDYFICIKRDLNDINNQILLRELRTLIYTQTKPKLSVSKKTHVIEDGIMEFTFNDIDIVNYSGLHSNTHRIHWDREYSKNVEGYQDIIVQGPFTIHLILKYVTHRLKHEIKSIQYKNINHIYQGIKVEICHLYLKRNQLNIWIRNSNNKNIVYVNSIIIFQ